MLWTVTGKEHCSSPSKHSVCVFIDLVSIQHLTRSGRAQSRGKERKASKSLIIRQGVGGEHCALYPATTLYMNIYLASEKASHIEEDKRAQSLRREREAPFINGQGVGRA